MAVTSSAGVQEMVAPGRFDDEEYITVRWVNLDAPTPRERRPAP